MSNATLGEILDRVAEFEARLENHYRNVRDGSQDNGVRLLTHFLGRHCRDVDGVVREVGEESLAALRRHPLEPRVEFSAGDWTHLLDTPPRKVNGRTLIELHMAYNEGLSSFCRRILQESLPAEAAALFGNLMRIQHREMLMLRKLLEMNYF